METVLKDTKKQKIYLVVAEFPDERKDFIVACDMSDYTIMDSFDTKQFKIFYPEAKISLKEHFIELE